MTTLARLSLVVLFLHLYGPEARGQTLPLPNDSTALARRFSNWLLSGRIDSLVPRFSGQIANQARSMEQLQQLSTDINERAGTELTLLEERWVWRNRQRQYWRFMSMSNFSETLVLRWVIDADGTILGWGVSPASQLPPVDPGPPSGSDG